MDASIHGADSYTRSVTSSGGGLQPSSGAGVRVISTVSQPPENSREAGQTRAQWTDESRHGKASAADARHTRQSTDGGALAY